MRTMKEAPRARLGALIAAGVLATGTGGLAAGCGSEESSASDTAATGSESTDGNGTTDDGRTGGTPGVQEDKPGDPPK